MSATCFANIVGQSSGRQPYMQCGIFSRGADKSLARPGRKKLQQPNSNFWKLLKKKKNQNVVRPTRSLRQQWPPRRMKNGDLSFFFQLLCFTTPTKTHNFPNYCNLWCLEHVLRTSLVHPQGDSCICSVVWFTCIGVSSLVGRRVYSKTARFETCSRHQKSHSNLENCEFHRFVLYK